MPTYKDLLELIARREFGIVGEKNAREIYLSLGLELDGDVMLKKGDATFEDVTQLMDYLKEKYGMVAIIGCKLPVVRMVKQSGLKLPDVFR